MADLDTDPGGNPHDPLKRAEQSLSRRGSSRGSSSRRRRRRLFGRRRSSRHKTTSTQKVKRSTLAIVALVIVAILALLWWLNSTLGNIGRAPIGLPDEGRPEWNAGTDILLLGTDSGTARQGPGESLIKDVEKDVWPAGKHRSDATMLLHIDEAEKNVYVMSFPRDSFVPIYDDKGQEHAPNKINSALSIYGPSGAISTVEHLTNVRVDHVAMVDWDGFINLVDKLGGVELSIEGGPPKKYDGLDALNYVRERKHLPNGDFDRVRRQQNFLRSLATSAIEHKMVYNPIQLKAILDAATENLAVDDSWQNQQMRSLAWSLRKIPLSQVHFMTIPTAGTDSDPRAGSIVVVDFEAAKLLFEAVRADEVGSWLAAHPEASLTDFVY